MHVCWQIDHEPAVLHAGAVAASRNDDIADTIASPFNAAWSEVDRVAPAVTAHPRITTATALLGVAGGFAYYKRWGKDLWQDNNNLQKAYTA